MKTPDIEPLKQAGVATQDEYIHLDNEGEEHEYESLVEIAGIGKVLTYKDVYFAPVLLFLLVLIIGEILFKKTNISYVVLVNCVLGVLLLWLTSKGTIISTVLYWLGIISSYFVIKNDGAQS